MEPQPQPQPQQTEAHRLETLRGCIQPQDRAHFGAADCHPGRQAVWVGHGGSLGCADCCESWACQNDACALVMASRREAEDHNRIFGHRLRLEGKAC